MKHVSLSSPMILAILLLGVTVTSSGCVLFGLGAATGATVGGCELLDENQDATVTRAELSQGLYDAWDTNDDGSLTEAEFGAGVDRADIYADWSGDFDEWDANDDGTVSQAEFEAGVAEDDDTAAWMDRQCDELGL